MTTSTDRIIASLSSLHDGAVTLARDLTDEQLSRPSGASEWTIADVLSHLGSGAEITYPRLAAAIAGEPAGDGDNQAVWGRWNAMSPREQADGFVEHDTRLVELLESTTAEQRDTVRVDLGFLPEPVSLATAAGMRLNEVAQHDWDVRVGLDSAATGDPEAAVILLDLFAGDLAFLLGFAGKADALDAPATVVIGDHLLVIADSVSVQAGAADTAPTATLQGSPESVVRLLGGRLGPAHTPGDVQVIGNVSLDDLRRVFPGY